jgi:uncharacterized protein YqjF (DUF2071 family)
MIDTDAIERCSSHRPWPMPDAPWLMFQSWRTQLFAHWPVAASALRPLVPQPLELDSFQGTHYVGVTPFELRDLRFRFLPRLPIASDFLEVNLRTYVRYHGKPGVFFFSLDAASRLAVKGARLTFRLPYFPAEMQIGQRDAWHEYKSRRAGSSAELVVRYRPIGPTFQAVPETLDHFLIERYALYVVVGDGRVLRGDIHHCPWRLQAANAQIDRDTIPLAHGIALPDTTPMLHYSERQDTLLWPPVCAT